MDGGKNRQKGFTLVELMVSMALAAILAMSLIQIVAPVYRTYRRTLNRADAQLIAGNVLDSIRKSAMRAGTVTADANGTGVDVGNGVYRLNGDGYLVFTPDTAGMETPTDQPVFDPKYYGGKTLTMSVENEGTGGAVVRVTVAVSGGDGELCTLMGVISTLRDVLNGGIQTAP